MINVVSSIMMVILSIIKITMLNIALFILRKIYQICLHGGFAFVGSISF